MKWKTLPCPTFLSTQICPDELQQGPWRSELERVRDDIGKHLKHPLVVEIARGRVPATSDSSTRPYLLPDSEGLQRPQSGRADRWARFCRPACQLQCSPRLQVADEPVHARRVELNALPRHDDSLSLRAQASASSALLCRQFSGQQDEAGDRVAGDPKGEGDHSMARRLDLGHSTQSIADRA